MPISSASAVPVSGSEYTSTLVKLRKVAGAILVVVGGVLSVFTPLLALWRYLQSVQPDPLPYQPGWLLLAAAVGLGIAVLLGGLKLYRR